MLTTLRSFSSNRSSMKATAKQPIDIDIKVHKSMSQPANTTEPKKIMLTIWRAEMVTIEFTSGYSLPLWSLFDPVPARPVPTECSATRLQSTVHYLHWYNYRLILCYFLSACDAQSHTSIHVPWAPSHPNNYNSPVTFTAAVLRDKASEKFWCRPKSRRELAYRNSTSSWTSKQLQTKYLIAQSHNCIHCKTLRL